MAEQEPTYRKLSGRVAGAVGLLQLWMTDDHFIAVHSTFGLEQYRRYFYRNIEAVIAVRTLNRLIWNLVLGTILLVAGTALVVVLNSEMSDSDMRGVLIALSVAGGPVLAAFLINTFKGPTCTFWVQVDGRLEKVGAPVRLPAVRKVIAQITPRIVQAQISTAPPVPVAGSV